MSAKVCAWASWAEWRAVYDQITSSSALDREKGVRRVNTWRTRGRLPVAVEITGSFVEIMLNDPVLNKSTQAPRSEHELRLMYSMAVVRLVNGIVDNAQRRSVAGSISTLAQELDWPQWFVDLRHEATHQKLPSLSLLRIAAKEALWLLLERFWRPQLAKLEQRGRMRSQAKQTGHRPQFGPALALRDHQFLDKRLRGLLQAASTSGASQGAEAGGVASDARASDKVVKAARDLAALAADESRLLMRLLALLKDREPDAEGQQAHAIRALSAHASDNFTIRFLRDLIMKALGSCGMTHEPLADNAPGVRNMCDSCSGAGAAAAERSGAPRMTAAATGCHEEAELNASRMLRWLQALMSRTSAASLVSSPSIADQCDARFANVAAELAPGLRCIAFRSMPAMSGTAAAMSRLTEVLQALRPQAPAREAAPRNVFSGQQSSTIDMLVAVATAHKSRKRRRPVEGQKTSEGPSLEDIETLLHDRKQQRRGDKLQSSREPWTALGTVLDPDSLQVLCSSEAAKVPTTRTAAEHLQRLASDITSDASVHTSSLSQEPAAVIDDAEEANVRVFTELPLDSAGEDKSATTKRETLGISEEDHRAHVAVLFQNLRPFGSAASV